jgi:replication factor C small subunit
MSSEIWTEKYRPHTFEEIFGQEEIVKRVKSLTNSLNIPHLLLAGPAGTGKSSLALVIVRELYGEKWKENYLELNASDERGIDVVRQKVKDFARTKSLGKVPFKVIFLDEADALTREAQQALRRTMENYSSNCRFVLSCNYMSKLIDPIQSRCVIFRFRLLDKKDVEKVIIRIAAEEKIELTPDGLNELYESSEGDCRRAINLMQATTSVSRKITKEIIETILGKAKPKDIHAVLNYALAGNFKSARDKLLDIMLKESISGLDVIKNIQKEVWNLDIDPVLKVRLTEKIGEIEFRVVEGSDEFIQLESLLAYDFAKKAHEGQFRKIPTTEPYIEHPKRVAQKIAETYSDYEAICAALLHDVIEDTKYTLNDINKKFGSSISFLVDGLTKTDNQLRTLEKIKAYSEKDSRVILIKLADRIDNMSTPLNKVWARKQIKTNTDFFIPLGLKYGYGYFAEQLNLLSIRAK